MIRKLFTITALSFVIAASFLGGARLAQARINGANTLTTVTQPDITCWGGTNQGTANTATEICIDWSGNEVPTTNNAQQSGSSSLQWKDVETANLNSGAGALTIGGAATFSKTPVFSLGSTLAQQTTAQLALRSDPVGTLFLAAENNQTTGVAVTNAFNECVSTAASVASYIYIAVSTNSAGSTPAVAGATCSK